MNSPISLFQTIRYSSKPIWWTTGSWENPMLCLTGWVTPPTQVLARPRWGWGFRAFVVDFLILRRCLQGVRPDDASPQRHQPPYPQVFVRIVLSLTLTARTPPQSLQSTRWWVSNETLLSRFVVIVNSRLGHEFSRTHNGCYISTPQLSHCFVIPSWPITTTEQPCLSVSLECLNSLIPRHWADVATVFRSLLLHRRGDI